MYKTPSSNRSGTWILKSSFDAGYRQELKTKVGITGEQASGTHKAKETEGRKKVLPALSFPNSTQGSSVPSSSGKRTWSPK